MKERGMIFSGQMVRANLDGRKGQTRRTRELKQVNENPNRWMLDMFDPNMGIARFVTDRRHGHGLQCFAKCPYGVPGDTFYMREKWWAVEVEDCGVGNQFAVYDLDEFTTLENGGRIPTPSVLRPTDRLWKWGCHPSIHMKKQHVRPERYEITAVRVERVRDISKEDAKAEGVHWLPRKTGYQHCFMDLWNKINLKRGYGWQMNPWCWCISYKKVKE